MTVAYYNENDLGAAAWLRELIAGGHIAPGEVDTRSIEDVTPNDIRSFTQCHFFAGIGGWSYALRLAGWPDSRPVWTGSCPCQPFSAAGAQKGVSDRRHLWPQFYRLIEECRPPAVFGEQVASPDGLAWLDLVSADMEAADYAFGAVDLCAAGIEAPHIRQRLYFVGESPSGRRQWFWDQSEHGEPMQAGQKAGSTLEHSAGEQVGLPGRPWEPRGSDTAGELVQPDGRGPPPRSEAAEAARYRDTAVSAGRWFECDWIECLDGKWRPVEPGTFPLAHGVSGRVGRLRGYGNAIVPQVAAEFVRSYADNQGPNP